MPGTAEHRMVRYPVLDAEFAKPPIGQIDLYLSAQPPLRAERKHVAHNQHPDHQHRIDRRPTCMRIVGRKLFVHPIEIKNAVDLPDQMIQRHHLVEIERVEELTLSALSPPHHRPLPRIIVLFDGITDQRPSQREFCNTIPPIATKSRMSRHFGFGSFTSFRPQSGDSVMRPTSDILLHLPKYRQPWK